MRINKIIAAALALTIVGSSFNCIQKCSYDTSTNANAAGTTTTQKAATTTVTTTSSKSTTTATVSKYTATTSVSTSVLSTSAAVSATPVNYTLGDVNNDGKINAVDASSVLAYYARISTNQDGGFTESQKIAADFNHDGQINAVDASNILSYYAYIATASENGNGSPSDKNDDSSRSEAEDISISFDMTGFEKNDLDMYAVFESVTELKGSLTGKDKISELVYTIENTDEKVVSSGKIKIDDNWIMNDFGLDIGSNTVTVTATDNEGKKISNSIIIINANMDNLSRTDADLKDDDNDELNNYFEEKIGTDPEKADTDGDGLTDYEELILVGSDPLSVDTDENGITDDAEDPDEDGLGNIKEVKFGTYTYMSDSDNDGISDGDEVIKYNTDPLRYDTDEDGLNDLADINMGFDPNKADTDNNGIPDSEEIIPQEITLSLEEPEIEGLLSVNIDTETNGDINSNTFLLNVYGIDSLASSAPGLIGVPVDIYFGTDFDNAKVTFKYDETALGDTDENDLGIIWHDTENDQLVLLDNTVVDTENNTVTYDTTHFSTYAVVDIIKFYAKQINNNLSQLRQAGITKHIDVYTDFFSPADDKAKYDNAVAFCDRIIYSCGNKDYLLFHHRKGGAGGYIQNFDNGVLNEHCRKMISGEYGTERYNPYIYLMTLGMNAEDDKDSSVVNTTVIMTDGTNAEHYSYVDNYVKLIDQAHNNVYVIDFGDKYDSEMAKTLILCGGRYIKVNDVPSAMAAANAVNYNPYISDLDGDGLFDINDPNPSSPKNYSIDKVQMNNINDVETIQRCLEYLGYLDMEGQDYGIFGGLTYGAVQLFQLNHKMYSEGYSIRYSGGSYYIDKNTFYAIMKEALDNGYSGVTNNISSIAIYNWFKREYIPLTQPLEEFDASVDPTNQCIISSVLRESIDTDNKYNDKVDIYIYDFSAALEKMLQYGAYEFHTHHYCCKSVVSFISPSSSDETYDNSSERCEFIYEDYVWLVKNVRDKAPYDIKVEKCWNNFMAKIGFNVPFYTSSFTFAFNSDIINAEIMGNILYGFSGHAGGYSKSELKAGGSVYSLLVTQKFDNDEDSEYIEYGYDLYDNYKRDYNYVHSQIPEVNYAGAYLVTDNFNYPVDYYLQDNEYKIPELDGGYVANYSVSKDTVIVLDDRGFCTQGYDNDTKFNFVNFYFVPFIDVYLEKQN